jgi:tetratricopeptide (TPR) repeat protein
MQCGGQLCKMKYLFYIIALLFLVLPVKSETILEKIDKGKISEARDEIGRSSSAAVRDGNLLFYQALIEPEGEVSEQFLDASVRAGLDPELLERNTYLSAQYYLASGNNEKAAATARAYLQRWENGKYRPQILRIASYAFNLEAQEDNASRLNSNMVRENRGQMYGYLGEIDNAYRLYREKDYTEAQNICRRLTNSGYPEVSAPAMYMLSKYSIEQKRVDDAILYYNLLKERYENAIGVADLVDRFANLDNIQSDASAEKITGSVYSIQVGVFSEQDNARDYAKYMKKFGENVDVSNKIVDGKKYYVVYIGKFLNTRDALSFKTRLEAAEGQAFQIIAR